jgi:tRNA A-37 threonylcarbamoyl transferase component Bud32/DNA-binding NarL/FixJ family response regulator
LQPRILAITDHPDFASLLEHHVTTIWADAEVRVHVPAVRGMLPEGFVAAGYDVVLLDHQLEGGVGLRWLGEVLQRPDFPPVLYFSAASDSVTAVQARESGATGCLARDRIDHRRFAELLRSSLDDRRRKLQLWRASAAADLAYRFGSVRIRGHRCIRQLASGGHSQVFLAESEKAGELVVLKVFREVPDKVEAHGTFNRFLQEYELVSQIRHPNVVRIHDLGIADDHAYIAMEYFPGGDLRQKMREPIPLVPALRIVGQIAEALGAIHQVGVLHRDLKPGNVMLRADGSVALIDFGLAKLLALESEMTDTGQIFGTPYYMSPEQGHGEDVDERSDFYSLGVILYEMLTRRKPFNARSVMGVIYLHRNGPLPALEGPLAPCEPILHRMLAKKPEDRFQTATDLASAVDALLASLREA